MLVLRRKVTESVHISHPFSGQHVHEPISTPGETVVLSPLSETIPGERLTILIKTPQVVVIDLRIPAGSSLPTHEAEGDMIVHCLNGRVAVTSPEATRQLRASQLLCLAAGTPFAVRAESDAAVLVTIIAPKQGASVNLIGHHQES